MNDHLMHDQSKIERIFIMHVTLNIDNIYYNNQVDIQH